MKKLASILVVLLTLFLVTCGSIPAESILAPEYVYVNVDSSIELNLSVIPSDTTDKTIAYHSVDRTIATVTEDGVLTGVSVGTTTLEVKVKVTPSVTASIEVRVVNKAWPTDKVRAFAGFDLPEYTDYSFVEVSETSNSLILSIKGTTNVDGSLESYKTLLLNDGWVVSGSYDNHLGTLTHPDYAYQLFMHNYHVHNGDSIEFKIVKSTAEGNEWPNAEILEHFGFELPVFAGYETITVIHLVNDGLEIQLKGITDVDASFHAFEHELEHASWVAHADNNHHSGRFDKEGVDAYISYHEGHDGSSFEIIITPIHDHVHELASWTEVNAEILEDFGFELPAFIGATKITLHHETSGLTFELSGFEDLDASFHAFEEALILDGWVADTSNTHHMGIFTKAGETVQIHYHEGHGETPSIELTLETKTEESH